MMPSLKGISIFLAKMGRGEREREMRI